MSDHICRSLTTTDAPKLAQFAIDHPGVDPWFRESAPSLLALNSPRRLFTVVEVRGSFETCLSWIYVEPGFVELGGVLSQRPLWVVEGWALSMCAQESDHLRSYGSGRAVELIYHTFNEANRRRLADAVCWMNVQGELAMLVARCEFEDHGKGVWLRTVRRSPPGSAEGEHVLTGGPS